jgi:hypothetical protein
MHKSRTKKLRMIALPLAMAAGLAGCSAEPASEMADQPRGTASTTPDIGVSAAPNVAFKYSYSFALEPAAIASVQEKHAAACERLGLARCRITGLRYSRRNDSQIDAELQLALAPDLARAFGRDASALVSAANGTIGTVEIEGEDKTLELDDATATKGHAVRERQTIEQRLSEKTLTTNERAELLRQLAQLKSIAQEGDRQLAATGRQLALTPMQFAYSTAGVVPGFSLTAAAHWAWSIAARILAALLALLILLGALALPAAALALGAVHAHAWLQRAWRRLAPHAPADSAASAI